MAFYRKFDLSEMKGIEEISVKQQDANSRTVVFELEDEGAPFDLSDKTVTFFAKRKGDRALFGAECSISSNKATVNLPGNMLSKNDILLCELSVIGEDYTISTPTFIVNVMALIRNDDYIEGTNEFSFFETAMQNAVNLPDAQTINEAAQRLENALNDLEQNLLVDGSVSISKTDFFDYDYVITSSNIFDEDYIRENFAFTPIEEGLDDIFTTDLIKVEPSATYLFSRTDLNHFETYTDLFWYDANQEYLSGTTVQTDPGDRVITVPQNAEYVQFSMYSDEINSAEHIIFSKVNNDATFPDNFIPEYEEYTLEKIALISDPELSAMFDERDNQTVAAANDYTDLSIASALRGGSITSAGLSNGSVSTSKIADNSVTSGKIANGSITAEKLADGILLNGSDGVGIASISQSVTSTEDSGENVITVTLTNNETFTFTVKNGSQGEKGDSGSKGAKGDKGERGVQGSDGLSPEITVTDITGGHEVSVVDADGKKTFNVMDGESAYDIAVKNGFNGTEAQWLRSITTSLPIPTPADAGKVLTVDSEGNYVLTSSESGGNTPTTIRLIGISVIYAEDAVLVFPGSSPDLLKPALTVMAHYSNNSTQVIESSDYTLSGTLTVGTSTVTVTYLDKTATFDAIVSQEVPSGFSISYNLTNSAGETVAQSSNTDTVIEQGGSFSATISPISPATISGVTVKMGDEDISDYVYDSDTGKINIDLVTGNLTITATNDVDIGLFMGQDNMSGHGTALTSTVCPEGKGFWYKQNTTNYALDYNETEGLYPITEPFGNEISATGSMVSALCLNYYNATGVPIVAISNSYSGAPIYAWESAQESTRLHLSIEKLTDCLDYLSNTGYNVRNKFMVWCHGESDGTVDGTDNDTTISSTDMSTSEYCQKFDVLRTNLRNAGIEEIFIIKIGQTKDNYSDFSNIRSAYDLLTADAESDYADEKTVIISDKFYGAANYMRDRWHYWQHVYNVVGADSGLHIADYYMDIPFICEQWSGNEGNYDERDNYGNANDYEYTISGNNITLNSYIGTNTNVYIYPYYMANGEIYKTKFVFDGTKVPTFNGNEYIESVTFDNAVEPAKIGNTIYLTHMFAGCTSLTTPPNIPSSVTNMSSAFYGCTSLTTPPTIPDSVTALVSCFQGATSLTSTPDIPDGVANIQNFASDATSLISVGTIGTGVTNMNYAFRNCSRISGTVRIESENVSNMNNAFSATAIPNITFEVPADSITYTTLTTTYPTANITTF